MKKKILRFLDPISGIGFGCLMAALMLYLTSSPAYLAILILGLALVGGSFFYHFFFPETGSEDQ